MDEKALAWAIWFFHHVDITDCIPGTCPFDCPYSGECVWAGCVLDEAIEWAERMVKNESAD